MRAGGTTAPVGGVQGVDVVAIVTPHSSVGSGGAEEEAARAATGIASSIRNAAPAQTPERHFRNVHIPVNRFKPSRFPVSKIPGVPYGFIKSNRNQD